MTDINKLISAFEFKNPEPGTYSGSWLASAETLSSITPIDSSLLTEVTLSSADHYEAVVATSQETFLRWREVPAPKRGEIIREMAEVLRRNKKELARLVSIESGKIISEGEGEIQEAIDIADFAVGLSRQLYGKTMHSERSQHRMYEQWHPLGPVAVITAFNFPAAVWAWNAMIAAVCGNSVIWKPSERTPLTAIAMIKLLAPVTTKHGFPALFTLLNGTGANIGQMLSKDSRIPLISATGSTTMGKKVQQAVAQRLGKSLLELGGNNAVIVLDDANLEIALRQVLFGSVGTAGQRCTTIRRIILQKGIKEVFTTRLIELYKKVRIGNPLEPSTLMGPLIHENAVASFLNAVAEARKQGGKVLYGGERMKGSASPNYVQPTLIEGRREMKIIEQETFAPLAYILEANDIDEAIAIQNAVPQGLSSAIFTQDILQAEKFLSYRGSDCGIANVNIGTSGAEIGGAFGGEKETGGGREAGSDSWQAYMRRQTCTINFGEGKELAQGVKFDL